MDCNPPGSSVHGVFQTRILESVAMSFSRDITYMWNLKKLIQGFPGGSVVKNLPVNAGDIGSISGPGRSTCCGATKPMLHS